MGIPFEFADSYLKSEEIATPACGLVRNDVVIWWLAVSIQQSDKLKFTLFYHSAVFLATVSTAHGKKYLTNGQFCSLITQTDNTKTEEAEVKLQAHPQRVLHS